MKFRPYIQPTCEVTSVSFLLNNNNYGNDEGFIGLTGGGAKGAELGQTNENGLFDEDAEGNNSSIWEEWN